MRELLERTLGPSYRISLEFPLSLPLVRADSNQLEMALLNLVVNARDAMPDGGTISITASQEQTDSARPDELSPGNYVKLAVVDTGTGMDAETLAHATEPFFTTKGIGKGTGLGLSMIHGLAEQMQGMLVLGSVLGQGTTAELWLPAAEPASGLHVTDAPALTADERSPSLKILVVDDDNLVLMNTVALLEDLGHVVIEASNGRDALEILAESGKLDLIITDQAMPHMTGVQLAEQVLAQWPGLPIILATGYGELPAGAPGSMRKLGKPFSQKELAAALAQTLR